MRKAILASMFLAVALVAFGQHGKSQMGGKTASKSKAKSKPKSKPSTDLNLDAGLVWVSPCGVYYKSEFDQYVTEDKWIFIGETSSEHFWYNTDKMDCDSQTSLLKSWVKDTHNGTDLKYALVLYELKCKTNQMRVRTVIEYDKNGNVLRTDPLDEAWQDSIPESIGETILKSICRRP